MFRSLFRSGPQIDLQAIKDKGAVIIDVRTAGEFSACHVEGSVNIPLDQLPKRLKKLPKNKPIIACCASGGRSGSAVNFLKANGYEAYNGGGWAQLNRKLGC